MKKLPGLSKVTDDKGDFESWTNTEIKTLHDMVRDYDRAKWFKGQLKWWAIWAIGAPTALITLWKSVEQIILTVRTWVGHP